MPAIVEPVPASTGIPHARSAQRTNLVLSPAILFGMSALYANRCAPPALPPLVDFATGVGAAEPFRLGCEATIPRPAARRGGLPAFSRMVR
jgi:hypothetical protein